MKHNGSTVSVAGDSRITPLGAKLRHYKLDELPELWDVLVVRPEDGRLAFVRFGAGEDRFTVNRKQDEEPDA